MVLGRRLRIRIHARYINIMLCDSSVFFLYHHYLSNALFSYQSSRTFMDVVICSNKWPFVSVALTCLCYCQPWLLVSLAQASIGCIIVDLPIYTLCCLAILGSSQVHGSWLKPTLSIITTGHIFCFVHSLNTAIGWEHVSASILRPPHLVKC